MKSSATLRRSGREVVDILLSASGAIAVTSLVNKPETIYGISFASVAIIVVAMLLLLKYRRRAVQPARRALLKGLDWILRLLGGALLGTAFVLIAEILWIGVIFLALDCGILLLAVDLIKVQKEE